VRPRGIIRFKHLVHTFGDRGQRRGYAASLDDLVAVNCKLRWQTPGPLLHIPQLRFVGVLEDVSVGVTEQLSYMVYQGFGVKWFGESVLGWAYAGVAARLHIHDIRARTHTLQAPTQAEQLSSLAAAPWSHSMPKTPTTPFRAYNGGYAVLSDEPVRPGPVRYARTGDVHIAYQVAGDGPIDIVLIDQWFSNLDAMWRLRPFARFVGRLSTFARVVLLDKRGTGLSDPVPVRALPTLEEWMDDVRAVLDAVGSDKAALLSGVGSSYLSLLFAATYPQRTSALALVDGYARLTATDDYLVGGITGITDEQVEAIRGGWGSGILLRTLAPGENDDSSLVSSFAEYERQSVSPGMAAAMLRLLYEGDVREVLPAIRVPSLVISHRDSARIPAASTRYLAEHIPGARMVELPGNANLIWAGDQEAVLDLIEEFLTGIRPRRDTTRMLATIFFTDIVGSTATAAALGDTRWRAKLEAFGETLRSTIEQYRGHLIKNTGDGVLATFDGPARAIRCAESIGRSVKELGLRVRCGLHAGEVELMGNDIGGIAVHIGARIMASAEEDEILVSRTIKDLVVGSGIDFTDRGEHELRGVPGEWRLYAVNKSP